jgi:carbonic anhydrase/acetyltransferase-like protein (isoleucine patch superfamily)
MILEFKGRYPKIHPTAFIAENAMVIGDVEIGPGSNIWFYSIVRGDMNYIRIGSNVNIQDGCVLHSGHKEYEVQAEEKAEDEKFLHILPYQDEAERSFGNNQYRG